MFTSHIEVFRGLPVKPYTQGFDGKYFANSAIRVQGPGWGEGVSFDELFKELLASDKTGDITALIIGWWGDEDSEDGPQSALDMLVASAARLPNLKALFVGDIVSEENELSWITQGNMSAIWHAFPQLEEFGARGGNRLELGRCVSSSLTKLAIETGGMPRPLLAEALAVEAPLTQLDLWIGTEDYGGNTSAADFEKLFSSKPFPELTSLGLKNCDYADDLVQALTTSPLFTQLSTLDMAFGTMTEVGARALLDALPQFPNIKRVYLDENYIPLEVLSEFEKTGLIVSGNEQKDPYEYGGEIYRSVTYAE